jgi:WD40 repeat protein
MLELVKSEISKKQLRLIPDSSSKFLAENAQDEREFDITVTNGSDRFASFQIELWTKGTEQTPEIQWYEVEPLICAKKPPGDRTTFHVIITKAPVPAYDTTVELTVKVVSVESDRLSTSETILLKIEEAQKPLKLFLPINDLAVYPGDQLVIPALVHNLSPRSTEVTLNLRETQSLNKFDPAWIKYKAVQPVRIGAGDSEQIELNCTFPQSPDVQSGSYSFEIEVKDQLDNTDSKEVNLEVLPFGRVAFSCSPQQQTIPSVAQWFSLNASAQYELHFINQSGLPQQISPDIVAQWFSLNTSAQYEPHFINQSDLSQQIPPDIKKINQKAFKVKLLDQESISELFLTGLRPNHKTTIPVEIIPHRPWIGREQRLFLQVTPKLSHPKTGETNSHIQVMPNTNTLELRVRPWVPFWLPCIGGLLGLLWLGSTWLSGLGHEAPVNSVRLIGNASTVVSGSSDQTIQRWQILKFPGFPWLWNQGVIANSKETAKAVRVIREIPAHEGQIVAGLENGAIQLWKVSPPELIGEFSQSGDRVFDLVFTQDSKNLFSGHGSSTVKMWDLQATQPEQNQDAQPEAEQNQDAQSEVDQSQDTQFEVDQSQDAQPEVDQSQGVQPKQAITIPNTAISALAVSEQSNQTLVAIAGQYNQLVLWNPGKKTADVIDYPSETSQFTPVSSRYDYINSLAISSQGDLPILVTADSKGWITTWNMNQLRNCTLQGNLAKFQKSYGNTIRQSSCQATIDQWRGSDNFQSVNAVAITKDGRYVASAGEDGKVQLWQINEQGERSSDRSLLWQRDLGVSLKSVDIQQPDTKNVLITSNAPHNRVSLFTVPVGGQP